MTLRALAAALALVSATTLALARDLSLTERIQARRAVEEVYWKHRTWPESNASPKPPLARVLSDEAIREKVEDALRKSHALESVWHRPIGARQLQAEIDRMARTTQDPRTLRELFDALGNDPDVIAETLARPALADRLLRSAKEPSFDAWWRATRATFEPRIDPTPGALTLPEVVSSGCTADTWSGMPFFGPAPRQQHVAVWTGAEMIVWGGIDGGARASGGRYDPATDTWTETSNAGSPSARYAHTAVWTGTEMIVWGGSPSTNTGGRYNPATNTWTPTSTGAGVPEAKSKHTAVWTGTEMIVWGGSANTGGRYNPATNTWIPTSKGANVPGYRYEHTAVWTGTEMIVWGGWYEFGAFNTGGRYNPVSDTWTPTSITGAPINRSLHTAVWTGTEMIVWGGMNGGANTGGRYNPATNSWTATSTGANVPAARTIHTAVWTGSRMIVWGGQAGTSYFNSGGSYDPVTNSWTQVTTPAAPAARSYHTALWTGNEMIVWGGGDGAGRFDSGGRYDPSGDSWVATASQADHDPQGRAGASAVWTGAEMIVWGGEHGIAVAEGGRYDPATNSWAMVSSAGEPSPRWVHTAVWTGTEMIVWGGYDGVGTVLATGGRYDPLTDTWTPTSTAGAPTARGAHAGVWTGRAMIVWGGTDFVGTPTTGGRYDPATNSWIATSTAAGVPPGSYYVTGVWTGTEMIVWGGVGATGLLVNTGGRYNPASDAWTQTSTGTNVPAARYRHRALWTGAEMIVWGGQNSSGVAFGNGARYVPALDQWLPVSTTSAPSARWDHSAVWTGTEMIVWGGVGASTWNTGARYAPATDSWTATAISAGVPSPRSAHASAYTGTSMIVWGGRPITPTGGAYCACPLGILTYRDADGDGYGEAGVPAPSCDGSIPAGFVADGGDCNDGSASTHPGAVEVCDGLDNDCNGTADDGIVPPASIGSLAMAKSGSAASISWSAVPGAVTYDVVEGTLTVLAASGGDFTAAVTGCVANDLASTSTSWSGGGSWILVRAGNCAGSGTFDEGSASQQGSRDTEIAASGSACP